MPKTVVEVSGVYAADASFRQNQLPKVLGCMVGSIEVQMRTCTVTDRTALRVVCPT